MPTQPIDAAEGRRLWEQLLARATVLHDATAQQFLSWMVESVVMDMINVRMATEPAFAAMMGTRIQRLLAAEAEQAQRASPDQLVA